MNYKEKYFKHHGLDVCDTLYCVICQSVAVDLHHVTKKSQLGTDHPTNIVPMCRFHHASHHDKGNPSTEEIKEAMKMNNFNF